MLSKNQPKDYLPASYTPSQHDVLCQKGKAAFSHPGNRVFRITVDLNLQRYRDARNKTEKTMIVSEIVDILGSKNAQFVRYDNKAKLYYSIDEEATREKVGQTLREAMIQNDPEKKARKKQQREITKAKRKERQNKAKSEFVANNMVVPTNNMVVPNDVASSVMAPPLSDGRRRSVRIHRQSLCATDIALAAMPTTLQLESSHGWFNDNATCVSDSELSGEDLDALLTSAGALPRTIAL